MAYSYTDIQSYVNQADRARKSIVDKCHNMGFTIPTDEIRESLGLEHVKISEIPAWLYSMTDAIMVCKTIETSFIEFQNSLLKSVPTLKINWDYSEGSIVKAEDLEYLSSSYDSSTNTIRHIYPTAKTYTIALFSYDMLDKVGSAFLRQNKFISDVKFSNVMTEIDSYALTQTTNLSSITFGDNLHTIKTMAFSNTNLTEITIPRTVKRIHGNDTFYTPLTSFIIPEDSQLEELYNGWIFNFHDRPTNDLCIYIPSGCKRYFDGNSKIISQDNISYNMMTTNPFSRCYNRISFRCTDETNPLMNDQYGVVYLKDETTQNPLAILNVPSYNIFDTYTIPSTVKYIYYQSFMCTPTNITVDIPSTVEYISPYFLYWAGSRKFFTSDNLGRYKTNDRGGLYQGSTLLYEPPITCDSYSFDSSLSSTTDYKNCQVDITQWVNSRSSIKEIKINKKFPCIFNTATGGPFYQNPINTFSYLEGSCDNYVIDDSGKSLYMKKDDNDHSILVGVTRNITSFDLNDSCEEIYGSVFYGRSSLTGKLDLKNIKKINAQNLIYNCPSINQIKIGNELTAITGYSTIGFNNTLSSIIIGDDESSKFTYLGSNIIRSNPNLSSIYIYSLNVTIVKSDVFLIPSLPYKKIYIHFTKRDGSNSTTYNSFVGAGFSINSYSENTYAGIFDLGW